jgi:hypothetical protein
MALTPKEVRRMDGWMHHLAGVYPDKIDEAAIFHTLARAFQDPQCPLDRDAFALSSVARLLLLRDRGLMRDKGVIVQENGRKELDVHALSAFIASLIRLYQDVLAQEAH